MDADRALLEARVEDALRIADERGYASFTPFLNEDELFFAQRVIERSGCENYLFYGGYPESVRRMLGVFPSYAQPDPAEFPLTAVTLEYPAVYRLAHRDFLGTLMGMQVRRDAVGDICPGEGFCVLFVRDSVAELVARDLNRVGRVGVKATLGARREIPQTRAFKPLTGTVASLRLDAVVALVTRISREKAASAVQLGQVMVNHEVVQSNARSLQPGDILSIRGYGKFILTDEIKPTKKGRLFITVNQYI